jgi:hypothetical protein
MEINKNNKKVQEIIINIPSNQFIDISLNDNNNKHNLKDNECIIWLPNIKNIIKKIIKKMNC